MGDRLTDLLHAEADTITVPHPPSGAILARGRRVRRARVAVPVLGLAAVAATVSAVVVLPGSGSGGGEPTVAVQERRTASFSGAQASAAERAFARSGAFAAGSKVYFGDLAQGVEIDDPAVRGLYYTSAGVLVRHGKDYSMDDSSRSGYSLVGTDGSVRGLDLAIGDVSPSADPTQPYLAYARPGGAADWEVVVLDLRDGEPAAVVPVEGAFSWGGWDAPPVALSGDHVYVGLDATTLAVDWRTGETAPTALPASRYPDVNADRYLQVDDDVSADEPSATVRVLDATTGEALLTLPDVGDRFASLSPDGEHVLVLPYLPMDEAGQVGRVAGAVLYDVATGRGVDLPPAAQGGYGWTPTGAVISVTPDGIVRCDAAGCDSTPVDPGAAEGGVIRIGGMVNES